MQVMKKPVRTTTIVRISKDVKERLDKLRHPGQTLGGIIEEMVQQAEQHKKEVPK